MRFTTNQDEQQNRGGSIGGETSVLIDQALEHNMALDRSNRHMDDLLSHGAGILQNLRDQRDTLKGIQRRMLDEASNLGMSSTVIWLMKRRQERDKYVLIGGVLVTCIVMYLVIRWFL